MSLLTLSIINLEQLQPNVSARHQFDRAGGTLGSAEATWQLNDREGKVAPVHCEIRWMEGGFCVIDHCQGTYLNASLECVGTLTARRLLEGDQLRVGAYRLLVRLSQAHTRSLEGLLRAEHSSLDHWLLDTPAQGSPCTAVTRKVATDICSVFELGIGNDPLAALEAVAIDGAEHVDPLLSLDAGARS
nr:FHA domain-containing protein [uncultured Pseudomonas sp.]